MVKSNESTTHLLDETFEEDFEIDESDVESEEEEDD